MDALESEKIRKRAVHESLDRTDFEILEQLSSDAWQSNKAMAERIGLAPSTCHDRRRRLEACGAIRGARAILDLEILGYEMQAMVAIRLERHAEPLIRSFRDHVRSLPEVLSFFHMAGKSDFLLHVGVRDARHLRQLILRQLTTRKEVAHVETALIFEHVLGDVLPSAVE